MADGDYVDDSVRTPVEVHEAASSTDRIARYFLYRNRKRQAVMKPKVNEIIRSREKIHRKRDTIEETSKLLRKSLGLKVVCPDEAKGGRFFVVRDQPYPKDFPIPFSDLQKEEYGLLTLVFFILYFNQDGMDTDQLLVNLELGSDLRCSNLKFGKWPDVLAKWASEDYLKCVKTADADPTRQKKTWQLGARFYAEFGTERLERMAKELIYEQEEPEPQEEEEVKEKEPEKVEEEEVEPQVTVVEERPRSAAAKGCY
jgi:hypothetical protein